MDKKTCFTKAYNYLRGEGIICTQNDLAKIMQASRSNISMALAGDEKVLTDKFIIRFANAFPGMFNLDYLLTGNGQLLAGGGNASKEPAPTCSGLQEAALVDIEFYRKSLELNSKVIADLRNDLDYFKTMVLNKDNVIQDNAREIINLQSRLSDVMNELARAKAELGVHHVRPYEEPIFPMGVAEPEPQRPHVSPSKP